MSRDIISPMNGRIPIRQGFFIELKNGRAISRGIDEQEALPAVLVWQRRHPGHENYERVEEWVKQKEKQIGEEMEERALQAKEDYVNAIIERVVHESKLDKVSDRELIAGIREEMLKLYGLAPPSSENR